MREASVQQISLVWPHPSFKVFSAIDSHCGTRKKMALCQWESFTLEQLFTQWNYSDVKRQP